MDSTGDAIFVRARALVAGGESIVSGRSIDWEQENRRMADDVAAVMDWRQAWIPDAEESEVGLSRREAEAVA